MKNRVLLPFVLILILLPTLSGCDLLGLGGGSSEKVVFTVPIDASVFSEEAVLRFVLWDSDQLEVLKRTLDCAISFDVETQTEEVHCPEGVEYEQATPEELSVPVQSIDESIQFESERVNVGESFRLQISGLSSDNCNTASANIEGTAQSAAMTIEDLMWMTTMMACL